MVRGLPASLLGVHENQSFELFPDLPAQLAIHARYYARKGSEQDVQRGLRLGEQKKKLISMLATAVTNLHKLETILPAVQDLGKRHKGYGVTSAYYAPVGAALLWTLEKGLGADFTPDVKTAWTEAYTALAGVMTAA